MTLTTEDMIRLRLHHQRLSAPADATPAEMVRWLVAVQSQDYAGAKWGLGLRLIAATDVSLERAFTDGSILRTHVLRPTWHFVAPDDIRWLLALTAPRVRARMSTNDKKIGVDRDLIRQAETCIEHALRDGQAKTREELRDALESAGVVVGSGQRLAHLVMHAELDGLIISGPRQGKQFTYMLLDERAPNGKSLSKEEALAELAQRYTRSRGPATARDFSWWSGLSLGECRAGLESARGELIQNGEYWLATSNAPVPANAGETTHLLSIFDEYFSAYRDRSALVEPSFAEALRTYGAATVNVIVLEGRAVGFWRREERKAEMHLTLQPFRGFTAGEMEAIRSAAKWYGAFWGKDVTLMTEK